MTCPLFISTVRPKSKIFVLFPSLVTELLPLNRNTLNCKPPVRPHHLSHITEALSVEDDGGDGRGRGDLGYGRGRGDNCYDGRCRGGGGGRL